MRCQPIREDVTLFKKIRPEKQTYTIIVEQKVLKETPKKDSFEKAKKQNT